MGRCEFFPIRKHIAIEIFLFEDAPDHIFALHKLTIKEIILNYCSFSHTRIIGSLKSGLKSWKWSQIVGYKVKKVEKFVGAYKNELYWF